MSAVVITLLVLVLGAVVLVAMVSIYNKVCSAGPSDACSRSRRATRISGNADAIAGLAAAEGVLSGTVGRLFALAESYPDLKANQNMMQLSEELRSTENKVAFARQAFNDSVTQYNTYKQTFPTVGLAGMFGHGNDAAMLEFDSEQIAEPPTVSF